MWRNGAIFRRYRWHMNEDGSITTHKNQPKWTGSSTGVRFAVGCVLTGFSISIAYFAYAQEPMLIVGRTRFVPIPRSLEKWLAIPFTKETIRDAKVLPADAPLVAAVQRLTDRITAAAALLGVHYDWKVYVVESDAQNAVCLPGGVVVVSTGVVMSLGELVGEGIFDSMDDALGTILCHEVGHAIARHQVEGLALQPWALALGATGPFFRWLATYGLALPYKRQQEREADIIGVHLMALAGLDVEAPMKFFLAVKTTTGNSVGILTCSHPTDRERALLCARTADQARAKYGLPPPTLSKPSAPAVAVAAQTEP